MEPAFYSDDSQSVASSMSDDPRTTHLHSHHQQHQVDVADHERDHLSSLSSTPEQKPPVPHNRFRPGGLTGSARGKGGVARNMKAALGNVTKALVSNENQHKYCHFTDTERHMWDSINCVIYLPSGEHKNYDHVLISNSVH